MRSLQNPYIKADLKFLPRKHPQMKLSATEVPSGNKTPPNSSKKIIMPVLTLFLLTLIPLYIYSSSNSSLRALKIHKNGSDPPYHKDKSSSRVRSHLISSRDSRSINLGHKCGIFTGNWVPYSRRPYYTNETECVIDDRQNCMKFGRLDTGFMEWRWKPDECELPMFNAEHFLKLLRGKTLAFVGDSVGRNQMQSLVCLLARAASPVDVSRISDTRFRRWHYKNYNFTIAALWSPFLIRAHDGDPDGYSLNSLMNLYLDEVDEAWATQIDNVDVVIISAGQWFFRPFMYYEKGRLMSCHNCRKQNVTELTNYHGYRMAFRTALRTLVKNQNYKGLTILRTFSPSHYENGEWDKGGNCVRTRPFTKQEMKVEGYTLEMYLTQIEELRAAEREGRKRGLVFRLLDTTEAMVLRPDGHPNHYGHWPYETKTIADCVHWCIPGPIDTWNEFLLQMLKMESEGSLGKLH